MESLAGADDETFGFGNCIETLFDDLPRYTSCGSEIAYQSRVLGSPNQEFRRSEVMRLQRGSTLTAGHGHQTFLLA